MVSRVSKVESDIGDVKSMLERLVAAQCGISEPPTQRSSSNKKAGLPKDSPAGGV